MASLTSRSREGQGPKKGHLVQRSGRLVTSMYGFICVSPPAADVSPWHHTAKVILKVQNHAVCKGTEQRLPQMISCTQRCDKTFSTVHGTNAPRNDLTKQKIWNACSSQTTLQIHKGCPAMFNPSWFNMTWLPNRNRNTASVVCFFLTWRRLPTGLEAEAARIHHLWQHHTSYIAGLSKLLYDMCRHFGMSYQEIPHFCHKEIDWNWYHIIIIVGLYLQPFSENLQIQKTAFSVKSRALDPFSNIPGCRCSSFACWVYVGCVTLITLSQAELIHETIWNHMKPVSKLKLTRPD